MATQIIDRKTVAIPGGRGEKGRQGDQGRQGEEGPRGPEGPYGGTEVTDPQVASWVADEDSQTRTRLKEVTVSAVVTEHGTTLYQDGKQL